VLAEVFPDSADEDRDGRTGGDSALMSLTVNQDGLLLKDWRSNPLGTTRSTT
jgi:hypothetical protein